MGIRLTENNEDFLKAKLANKDNAILFQFIQKHWSHWKLRNDGEKLIFDTYNRFLDFDSIDEITEETGMRISQIHYSVERGLEISFTKIGDDAR